MTWPFTSKLSIRCRKRPKLAVVGTSARLGLNLHRKKSKVLKVDAVSKAPTLLKGEALEEAESFTYLGSTIEKKGGTDAHVRARIGKARVAFHQLKNI